MVCLTGLKLFSNTIRTNGITELESLEITHSADSLSYGGGALLIMATWPRDKI